MTCFVAEAICSALLHRRRHRLFGSETCHLPLRGKRAIPLDPCCEAVRYSRRWDRWNVWTLGHLGESLEKRKEAGTALVWMFIVARWQLLWPKDTKVMSGLSHIKPSYVTSKTSDISYRITIRSSNRAVLMGNSSINGGILHCHVSSLESTRVATGAPPSEDWEWGY